MMKMEARNKRPRHDSDSEDEQRLRDEKEMKEMDRKIRERDACKTRKLRKEKEKEKVTLRSDNGDISRLRMLSRMRYLKEREQKKLDELRDEIVDEEYLFKDVKVSENELRDLRRKKQVFGVLSKRSILAADDLPEYKMPESYDFDQSKRFSVLAMQQPFKEKRTKTNPFAEQEAWEKYQFKKSALHYGSKNKGQGSKSEEDYPFVFEEEDPDKLIRSSMMDLEEQPDQFEQKKFSLEKLQENRKTLPVYTFRDKLLQAIRDHQILIIEGETGSGKTTQIPQYLHEAGFTKHGKIGCTQPRRVAAMSVAARVAEEMEVKQGNEVGYAIRFEDCTSEKTVLKYMTDGMLLREFLSEPDLASYSVIMLDEAHERTLSTDILFGLLKDIARFRQDLKLLISSATLDAVKFSNYFDYAPIFRIPGRKFPFEVLYMTEPEKENENGYVDIAVNTALQIHIMRPPGDILVFLTGQEEIEEAEATIKNRIQGLGTKISELIVCPIYSNLPTELQAKIFEPTPKEARKVVLATNIAEASLTIDGIKYVVDSGYCKLKSYDPRSGMESLKVRRISKASAQQRAGRSGRTEPGICFRLYTEDEFKNGMEDNTAPEIQRINLANVVLTLKNLGIHDLLHFDFMDPPSCEALIKALELLFALGALNRFGELTKVGRRMAEFPLDPMLSKMIVASERYNCSEEIITIAAMLSTGNSIFYRPKNKQEYADNARMNFHRGNVGDHIALLNVYNSWRDMDYSTQWCYENFIQVKSMKRARDIRDQLAGLLDRVEIELTKNVNDLEAITKSIASGFFPNSARLSSFRGCYKKAKHPQEEVYIHPSSGMAKVKVFPKWVMYHELVETQKGYMRQVIEIQPEWLVEIAPHYYEMKDVEDLY